MHVMPNNINSAQRIISLVPSQTELLYSLGLDEEVVGITKFCVHPQTWFKTKQRVGGTKNFHLDRIYALKPDLILANKEENTQAQIEKLQTQYPVYISDIQTIKDALQMIADVGYLVNKKSEAAKLIEQINIAQQTHLQVATASKTLYLIWHQPYMAAGVDTFINDMMKAAGFENCVLSNRYPSLSMDEIIALNPSHIFLSSEPFPFKQKHIDELKNVLPNAKVILVDGELFSWYGSRMLQSFEYFSRLNEQLA